MYPATCRLASLQGRKEPALDSDRGAMRPFCHSAEFRGHGFLNSARLASEAGVPGIPFFSVIPAGRKRESTFF